MQKAKIKLIGRDKEKLDAMGGLPKSVALEDFVKDDNVVRRVGLFSGVFSVKIVSRAIEKIIITFSNNSPGSQH